MPKRIMVPLDGSPLSERALLPAEQIAQLQGQRSCPRTPWRRPCGLFSHGTDTRPRRTTSSSERWRRTGNSSFERQRRNCE